MFDAGFRYDNPRLQRAEGELHVGFRLSGGLTALAALRQSGCLKARFPYRADPRWLDVATLNSSGGIAGGDSIAMRFTLGPQTRATIATQAAERIYRVRPGEAPSNVRTSIDIADGAYAEWLPQETILFDGAALSRLLLVELGDTACFLGLEMLVFGRISMGESVKHLFLRDTVRIIRNGKTVTHDITRIQGDAAALLDRPAVAAGMRGLATVYYVAPDAEARLRGIQTMLVNAEAGASVMDDLLVARILAPDGAALRRTVIAALQTLRGRSLPRVWMC